MTYAIQRRSGRVAWVLIIAIVAVLTGLAPAARAGADDPRSESVSAAMRYQVTFVAQACSGYSQIMANQVRDDATEATTAPGRDSAYDEAEPIDPDLEGKSTGRCDALSGWHFTLGTEQQRKGPLSTVAGATADIGPTVGELPRLDDSGQPIPGKSITGAVTAVLTDEQVRLAGRRELWAQGGTPADPLMAAAVPGLGFGVLRCGIDERSAGNVAWIAFPPGVRHVFCYAYYVSKAPGAGTVIVRAGVTRSVGYPQRLSFGGTLSFTAAKAFTLATAGEPVEAAFTRSEGGYRVAAQPPPGWRVGGLACAATRSDGVPPKSAATVDPIAGVADLRLAAGEVLTCTYSFEPPPDPPGLTVRLFSDGAAGSVGVTVDNATGAGAGGGNGAPSTPSPPTTAPPATPPTATPPATTPPITTRAVAAQPLIAPLQLAAAVAGDGSAVLASGADLSTLPAGTYRITVAPPDPSWVLVGATCGGDEMTLDGLGMQLTLASDIPTACTLRMARMTGGLKLQVVTAGGIGGGAFAVVPAADAGEGWAAAATTTGYGVAADAKGDLPEVLGAGAYIVTPIAPLATADGDWKLNSFGCDPVEAAVGDGGALVVTLSAAMPAVGCTVSYQFVPATRFQVTLGFEGEPSARGAAAILEISCSDGSTGRVVLALDDLDVAALPEPLSFSEPTRCNLTQPTEGAARDASVTVIGVLDPEPAHASVVIPGAVDIVRDVSQYTLTVTDSFHSARPALKRASVLSSFSVLPMALIGSGVFGLGALMLLVMVVRSRRTVD